MFVVIFCRVSFLCSPFSSVSSSSFLTPPPSLLTPSSLLSPLIDSSSSTFSDSSSSDSPSSYSCSSSAPCPPLDSYSFSDSASSSSDSSSTSSFSSYKLCAFFFYPVLCVSAPPSTVLWSSWGSSGLLLFSCSLRYLYLHFFTSCSTPAPSTLHHHFIPFALCFYVLGNDLQSSTNTREYTQLVCYSAPIFQNAPPHPTPSHPTPPQAPPLAP